MKRMVVLCFLMMCLSLFGCRTAADVSKKICEQYQTPIEATIQVSALSGVACDFQLDCTVGKEESVVTIAKPESLAGLKAVIQSNMCSIQYEDLMLDSLMVPMRGMTPMDCFDQTIFILRNEIPVSYGYEKKNGKESLCLTFQGEVSGYAYTRVFWLEERSFKLLEGEYYLDGILVMRMSVEDITFTETSSAE